MARLQLVVSSFSVIFSLHATRSRVRISRTRRSAHFGPLVGRAPPPVPTSGSRACPLLISWYIGTMDSNLLRCSILPVWANFWLTVEIFMVREDGSRPAEQIQQVNINDPVWDFWWSGVDEDVTSHLSRRESTPPSRAIPLSVASCETLG